LKVKSHIPQKQKKKMPRHCRNCGEEGHEIRTCNDEGLKEERNEFYKKIHRRVPIEEILENAKSIALEKMRLITYKTEKGKVSKISSLKESEDTYYEKLENYIKKEYEIQEEGLKKKIILKTMIIRMHYQLPLVNPNAMYHSYIRILSTNAQRVEEVRRLISRDGYPSEEVYLHREVEEPGTWENMIEADAESLNMFMATNSFNRELYAIYPSYEMMTRWLGFLLVIQEEYRSITRTNHTHPIVVYNFIKRLQTENETIECPICMENISTPEISEVNCGHKFCRSCIRQTINRNAKDKRCGCPMCRTPIEKIVRKFIKND
jgi:hypothetical protein